ncbi:hypothetical protein JCM3766R1_007215 [Sporobolomyces carnicolor]
MWLRRQNQAFLRSELAAIPEGDQQSLKEERERLVEELKTADAEASGLSLPKTRKKKSEPNLGQAYTRVPPDLQGKLVEELRLDGWDVGYN